MGADEAIYYLLAWTNAINQQDHLGFTPLHTAIDNINRYSHYRPLKEMLIKGASRVLKDNQGRTPLDII